MLIITKNNQTFRGEEGEIDGEDAAVTNGAANTNGEKLCEEARPKAEWVVASRCKSNIQQTAKIKYLT